MGSALGFISTAGAISLPGAGVMALLLVPAPAGTVFAVAEGMSDATGRAVDPIEAIEPSVTGARMTDGASVLGGTTDGEAGVFLATPLRDDRPKSPSNAWRSDCPSRLETMLPLKQKLMVPRSSLTTTTTASVSSVMPSAARWREPSCASSTLVSGIGKKMPARAMRRFRMSTAPSWSLFTDSGTKSETSSSRVTTQSRWMPSLFANSRTFASCSNAMSAPMRWRASSVAAATTSSMTRDCCSRPALNHVVLPIRMSARRMSFWKTTTTMSTMLERSDESSPRSVASFRRFAPT